MGFETTVVISIFFITSLVLGTHSYAVMSTSNDIVTDAEDMKYNMQYQKLNSKITINSMALDDTSSILDINITNNGNIVLASDEISILLDGKVINYTYTPETRKWYPDETKMFSVTDDSGFKDKRVKVVTDIGIIAYKAGIPDMAAI
ncbi:flagellar protein F [Methanococcoides burtonii]|uniref:Archaeal flagellar protein F n=1 Tax=Methanococcoides burtonii (strain DSM 6242 / NBRC 107633 / OCM 468 / ACE-M) TaxID=259564 RepID=Q12VQ0_METBU|nr:flagellar protein F [Methanococcoides burtonii]ABE52476.1 Archaeal flagellar protein F [Methanococcoides burtonii DSM 6242]